MRCLNDMEDGYVLVIIQSTPLSMLDVELHQVCKNKQMKLL